MSPDRDAADGYRQQTATDGDWRGTQHLTALAAPEALVDWRLALCFDTAYSMGVLDELPGTAAQIAEARGLDVSAVRAIVQVLAAWGHVDIDEQGVVRDGPDSLGPREREALAQHGSWIRRWAALLGQRVHDRRATTPDEPARPDLATGHALLESASRPYIKPVVEACLSAVRGGARGSDGVRVLDLGGGHGGYALEFAERGCVTTLQDLPAVIDHGRTDARLVDAEIDLVAGDAFDHFAPGPFDLIVCGTFTNLFTLERVGVLLDRVRESLAPGGQIAIVSWLREQGPVGAAFGVQMLVATPEGDAHSFDDYRAALQAGGYRDIRLTGVGEPPLAVILARR